MRLGLVASMLLSPAVAASQYACPLATIGDDVTVFRIRSLGATLAKSGQYGASLACYREVLQRAPNDFASHMNAGIMLELLKQFGDSEREFELALPLSPDQVGRQHILFHLGYTNARLGQYQVALTWFEQAAQADTNDRESWANAARVAHMLGKDSLARAYLARAAAAPAPGLH